MNTKILMIVSALFLGIMGLGLTFLPEEISKYLNSNSNQISIVILQILGSLYLGFAMLNWMTKNNLIGGIYSKPLLIGNLVHFLVSTFALIKVNLNHENNLGIVLTFTIIYSIFTLCFSYLFINNPKKLTINE